MKVKENTWSSHCIACNSRIVSSERQVNKVTKEHEPYCRVCWYWISNAITYHEEDHWRVYDIVWKNPDEMMGGECREMELAKQGRQQD